MISNYRKIGDFIRQSKSRNDNCRIKILLGVNLDKEFMPSVANLNGVDLSRYKVIKKGQFGCKLMSVGRDKKVPISRLKNYDEAIISSAYFVFEVKNEIELNSEYLMMWFSRSESDRFQWFQSGGDIRGRITWEEFCSLPIKVPSIEKQREIVKEYNTIINRIKLNEQLNQKLEETAQALYRHWFVDFEFPNENGQPYKSSGGKMIHNEELDKEIPEGWSKESIGTLANQFSGYSFKGEQYSFEEGITVVRGENVTEQKLRWDTHKMWSHELNDRMKKCFLENLDFVIGMDGSKVGKNWSLISEYDLPLLLAQRVTCVRSIDRNFSIFLYLSLAVNDFEKYVSQVQTGTSVPHISAQQISDFSFPGPPLRLMPVFQETLEPIFNRVNLNLHINSKLENLRKILLVRLSKTEETKIEIV